MEETLLSIAPDGYYFYFWLFSSIALLIGASVYLILRRPSLRRVGFTGLGKTSMPVSLVTASLISFPMLVYFYNDSWGYFFRLKLGADTIAMEFLFPARVVELARSQVTTVKGAVHMRKTGPRYRLVLAARDGSEYASQLMTRDKMQLATDHLQQVLQQPGE